MRLGQRLELDGEVVAGTRLNTLLTCTLCLTDSLHNLFCTVFPLPLYTPGWQQSTVDVWVDVYRDSLEEAARPSGNGSGWTKSLYPAMLHLGRLCVGRSPNLYFIIWRA